VKLPRFEVRSTRNGYIQGVHGTIDTAIRECDLLLREFGDRNVIVDTFLPTVGDRIVWRNGDPSEGALTWMRAHATTDTKESK
jgi:hypothetical protein